MKLSHIALSSSLALLVGCGATPEPKNASDEAVVGDSETTSADMAPPPPKTVAETPAGEVASADELAKQEEAKPSQEPLGPTTLKGKISGGDFAPKVALIHTPTFGDRAMVEVYDQEATCENLPDAADGHRSVEIKVPWAKGNHSIAGDKASVRFGLQRKGNQLWGAAKSGAVTVLEAPKQQGAIGRIRINASAPKEKLSGEIDVHVCVAPH